MDKRSVFFVSDGTAITTETLGNSLITLAIQLSEIDTRPKALLERQSLVVRAPHQHDSLNNHKPGRHRCQEQNQHHRLHQATGANDPDTLNAGAARIPLGRAGEPLDIANCILYLASDESKYVTGAEFVVDAGMTAQ